MIFGAKIELFNQLYSSYSFELHIFSVKIQISDLARFFSKIEFFQSLRFNFCYTRSSKVGKRVADVLWTPKCFMQTFKQASELSNTPPDS